MKILVFGAGNLLLSDEGFGVHAIRYLEEHYLFPDNVELYDGGTLGIMVCHKLEEAERVYLLDIVDTAGEPGTILRYEKEEIMYDRIPVKMSPHQIGIQEVLFLSEMRGSVPDKLSFIGIIPQSLDAGIELAPCLKEKLPVVAEMLVKELVEAGVEVLQRAA